MKHLPVLLAAAIALVPATAFANENDREQTINGRSHQTIISILQQKGIDAERVEEWGGVIRVDTHKADGSNAFILIDKNTLQIRQPASGVATQLSVRPTGSGWSAQSFGSTESLVEGND
jgi:type III secretory pathway lipoprotein EscJ